MYIVLPGVHVVCTSVLTTRGRWQAWFITGRATRWTQLLLLMDPGNNKGTMGTQLLLLMDPGNNKGTMGTQLLFTDGSR